MLQMIMNFAENEQKILEFWKKNRIFKKSVEKDAPRGDFVFYEGPPTANGKPGIHHVLARAFKDLIPRFKTMQGFKVERRAGWDTHGLPVELEVEKELGLKNKKDVEDYGIGEFNNKCKESVWKYKEEWEKMTERIGFWLDMKNPYITYSTDYIETLWRIIKQAHKKGLLYKGHKVIPNCPRCGTSLSSHEMAQGYKNIEEESIYIKFKIKNKDNEYILAWTTTPWTLPGNVALAVNKDFDYVKIRIKNQELRIKENLILARDRLKTINNEYEIVEEIKGKDLIGLEYEPLFPGAVPQGSENYKNAFKIYPADFVSTEDGTGVVHTAVMYGVEDYELGKKVGLPEVHTVNLDGTFNELVPKWRGRFVKDADSEIIRDLKDRKLLYKTEEYLHDYPFCWRCNTPLIYYAKDSWYFRMSQLRSDLIKNSKQINWIPKHIKEGRFGEWLREVKDWAISRERYWGTPIPIWQCEKCEGIKVVGSVDEIRNELSGPNKIFLVRHTEAGHNVDGILDSKIDSKKYPLTERGEKFASEIGNVLKKEKIDMIFSSPLLRTCQTAEAIGKKLDLRVVFEGRLREIGAGEFEGKTLEEFYKMFPTKESRVEEADFGVETGAQVRKRLEDFLEEINKKYKGKNIVVVSHGDPLQIFYGITQGMELPDSLKAWYPSKGSVKQVYSKPIDLHRPYIDKVELKCECGGEMKRIPEVMDCWFDSGAMPFAAGVSYPADFISEAIDQTRGWFYTLLAVATILGKEAPYKNVICLGHVLDKEGKKMSKSLGNIVDPMEMIEKYGADTARWYLYIVNQPGDSKLFDEKGLKESRRVFVTLFNVLAFYKMFIPLEVVRPRRTRLLTGFAEDAHILDKWINSKLALLTKEVTNNLEKYDITSSARKIEEFVNDLSVWYVRRSRDRFKGADGQDKSVAQKTLYKVLLGLSKVMAPFAPFIAERIYQEIEGRGESVHLEDWPKPELRIKNQELRIIEEMKEVRRIVSLALNARLKAGIKVRQPLKELRIKNRELRGKDELLQLIKDEVNVKEIVFNENIKEEIELATELTPELIQEGMVRDLVRVIQDLRKKAGLTLEEKVNLIIETDERGEEFVDKFEKEIKHLTNLSLIKFGNVSNEYGEIKIGAIVLRFEI